MVSALVEKTIKNQLDKIAKVLVSYLIKDTPSLKVYFGVIGLFLRYIPFRAIKEVRVSSNRGKKYMFLGKLVDKWSK